MGHIEIYDGYNNITVICKGCGKENKIDLPDDSRDYGFHYDCECGKELEIHRDDGFGSFKVEGCFIKDIR